MPNSSSSSDSVVTGALNPRVAAYLDNLGRALISERERGMPRWDITGIPPDSEELGRRRRADLAAASQDYVDVARRTLRRNGRSA